MKLIDFLVAPHATTTLLLAEKEVSICNCLWEVIDIVIGFFAIASFHVLIFSTCGSLVRAKSARGW